MKTETGSTPTAMAIPLVPLSHGRRLLGLSLCFLVMVCDGFDLIVMAQAMPAVASEWRIAGVSSFGPVFSAAIFGIMIGAPLLGSLADRIGRRAAMILSVVFFGVGSLAVTQVNSIGELVMLRFVNGVGLGGAFPLSIVISAELMPAARRATAVAMVTTGATLGAAISGFSASWLLPHAGWRSLFVLGGTVPLVVGLLSLAMMPETAPHLLQRHRRTSGSETRREQAISRFRDLFRGPLGYVTPLLWSLFVIIGAVSYFINSWGPTLFTAAGYPLPEVAALMGIFQAFGAIGGLAIGWPVDRFGVHPVTLSFVLAATAIAAIAQIYGAWTFLQIGMAVAGSLILALQIGMNAISALVYPAAIRAKGVGWGLGTVRVGQVLGASGGGMLVGRGVSLPTLFYGAAVILLVGAVACWLFGRSLRDRRHAAACLICEPGTTS